MYRRNIDVVIASRSENLAQLIADAPMDKGISISATKTDATMLKNHPNCDILICDFDQLELDSVEKTCTGSAVVLCLYQNQFERLPTSLLAKIADVWIHPFSSELICFRYQKLIQQILLERKLTLNQTYLDTLINSVPDLIWFKRLDGIHVKVNDSFCSTVQKERQDVEGYDHYHIWSIPKEIYENSDYVCLDTDSIVIQSKKPGVFDETVAEPQGMRQLKTYKSPIFDDCGKLIGTVGVAQDVTELKNTDAKLDLILRTMPFAVMITDTANNVLMVNQKFEEYFQVSSEDLAGESYLIKEASAEFSANPPNLLYCDQKSGIGLLCNGKERILDFHTEPINDFFGNFVGMLNVFRDVTMERGLQAQLKQIAYRDQLTGLFTRRYLFEDIREKMIDSDISMLYIDLDNFKLINDTLGHHYGDIVLKKSGRIIKELFPNDACIRMGGDEFVIVILGKHRIEELQERAEQLIRKFKCHFPGTSELQALSVSIGIAKMTVTNPVQFDELLRKSDSALYEAKISGKAHCVLHTLNLESAINHLA
ncbi:hypothetical protein SDC9_82014 [bioreactor metagenome]|uniref:GGDEF domain-containing protein n=1 Tax=bioreactor metagenome TaxID=1076179 RepID=A0A644Z3P5_9ZZZZ